MDGNLVSRYVRGMGKGLSPLQRVILAVLEQQHGWIRPKDILDALGREPTPSNRTAVSKALDRLWARDLIETGHSEVATVGKSYLYRVRPG